MRILHLTTEKTWRGGENQIRLLMEGLNERGIKNHLATRVSSPAALRLMHLAPQLLIKSGGYHIPSALKVAAYVRKEGIEILDAHTSATHSLGLLVKKMLPQLKLVVHRRVDNPISTSLLTHWKYHSSCVDRYVAISEAIANILVAYGISPERIAVVKSASEMPIFSLEAKQNAKKELAREFAFPEAGLLIGNASALDRQKDPISLIHAFRILVSETNLPLYLILAGDGNLQSDIKILIQKLSLKERVILTGFRKDVRQLLLGLDIVALPSVNEGLGTTLLDSLACGCAVIATSVGGIPEIIQDQKTGLLISPSDPELLAAKLKELAFDPQKRGLLAKAGCAHVQEKFSVKAMVEGNLAVYQQVLET